MSEGVAAQKQTQMIFGVKWVESKTSMGLKHKELERLEQTPRDRKLGGNIWTSHNRKHQNKQTKRKRRSCRQLAITYNAC